ncbi:MAG: LPS assembly lipoprotein LptE, partial [Burkholderiaceae bacterium]|nr:LPS assembly lipoprotein LptE [Burkholderiaceae bacterium]
PKEAEAKLEILQRERTREVLSLNVSGRVREYAIFYNFRFRLLDADNQILIPPSEIRLRRTLTYSETEALSKEREEETLYRDMENEAVILLMQRLVAIRRAPTPPPASPN